MSGDTADYEDAAEGRRPVVMGRCESCGGRTTVVLPDGSKWCDSCDEAAKRMYLDLHLDRACPKCGGPLDSTGYCYVNHLAVETNG